MFAYHGYPWLIHRLTYRRHNHGNIHVRGYKEEGTTTTPFDMVVRNNMDRFQLAIDSLARLPDWKTKADDVVRRLRDKLELHGTWVREHGEDMPEVRDWRWTA